MKPEIKKQIILHLPYLAFVYLFGKVGQAFRLAQGADLSAKLLHIGQGFSAAFASAAPGGVADFKVHGAGESFRSDSVQLQADTLTGFKFVFLIVVAGLAVAAGEVAVLTIIKAHDPLALRLEIDSVGAGRHTKHETSRDKECGKLLHDKPSFLSDCTKLCRLFSKLSRGYFPFPCGTYYRHLCPGIQDLSSKNFYSLPRSEKSLIKFIFYF